MHLSKALDLSKERISHTGDFEFIGLLIDKINQNLYASIDKDIEEVICKTRLECKINV